MKIKLTFLGTGTSYGVPKVNCYCPVCVSSDPCDRRLRSSILIEYAGKRVIVDTSADFRQQALIYKFPSVDAILFTHAHADHLHGIDDIRAFQKKDSPDIECFGSPAFCEEAEQRFDYIFTRRIPQPGHIPRLTIAPVEGRFDLFGLEFETLPVVHGIKYTIGYRFADIAYIPDVKVIPPETLEKLKGLDIFIIDALRHKAHTTHMTVAETLDTIRLLNPKMSYLTHIDHELSHSAESEKLAATGLAAAIAYDGLVISK